jgi:pyruvate-formate lyase-activating enzyme
LVAVKLIRSEHTPVTGLVADTIRSSIVDGPGNRFVVFLQGCNFDCIACHNPQTIPGHSPVEGYVPRRRSVEDLLADIREVAPFLRGITVSGGEATQQPRFIRSLFDAVKADPDLQRLTCFVDSNGGCSVNLWDDLAPRMDGAMIDLKCFDSAVHEQMTGQPNDRVLASITHLEQLGLLHEVRLLIIDGVNDHPDLIRRTGEWLAAVNPGMRIKVIGFRSHGSRPQDPPLQEPSSTKLNEVADLLGAVGHFELQVV